ncbi:methyltransferase domain-containing protein [Deferribacteres bacterium DY0037]
MINYYEQKGLWDRDLTPQETERLDLVKKIIPEDVVTVLDVGCGNGSLTNGLEGYDITGLDKSVEALKYYKHKKQHGSIDELPFTDNSFDLIICSDVLEHLDNSIFNHAIRELKRVSKKYILIISPNEEDLAANFVKCHACNHIFNVNLHERSLGFEDLIGLFGSDFVNLVYTYFGDKWANEPEVKYKLKRAFNKGYKSWEHAVCPRCGTKQKAIRDKHDYATDAIVNPHVMGYYNHSTEVMILFCDSNQSDAFYANNFEDSEIIVLNNDNKKVVTFIHKQYIDCRKPLIKRHTEAYPQIAYLLDIDSKSWSSTNGQTVLKIGKENNVAQVYFPAEEGMSRLYLKVKSRTYNKVNVNVYDVIDSYKRLGVISNSKLNKFVEYSFELPSDLILSNEGLQIEFVVEPSGGEVELVFDKLYIDHDLYSLKCGIGLKSSIFGNDKIAHVVGDKIHIPSGYYVDLGVDDYLLIDGNLYWNISNSFEVLNQNKPIHDKDYFFYRLIVHYEESFKELEKKLEEVFKVRDDESVDYTKYIQTVKQQMYELESSLSGIRASILEIESGTKYKFDSVVQQFDDSLSENSQHAIDREAVLNYKIDLVDEQVKDTQQYYEKTRDNIKQQMYEFESSLSGIRASILEIESGTKYKFDSVVQQFDDSLSENSQHAIDREAVLNYKIDLVDEQVKDTQQYYEKTRDNIKQQMYEFESSLSGIRASILEIESGTKYKFDSVVQQFDDSLSENSQHAIDREAVLNYKIDLVDEQVKDTQQYYEKTRDNIKQQMYELQSQVCALSNVLQQSVDNRSILSYSMSAIASKFSNKLCRIKSRLSRFIKENVSTIRQTKVATSTQCTHVDTSRKHLLILTPDVMIDRRTVQMCESMIKEFGIRCTIIAALEADDDFVSDSLIVKRVSPYDTCGDGGTDCSWQAPKCYDLEKFYWLHNKYLIKALDQQADYVMCCDLPVLPCAVHVAKHMGVPLIYDAHELYPEQVCFTDEQRSLYKGIEQYYIGLPDLIMTVNDSIAIEMGEKYGVEKPNVILNAIDAPDNFDVDKKYDYFREKLPIRSDQKIVLFQGGYSPNRNLELFVKSAQHIKDSRVVLVLMGFGDFGAELEKIAKEDRTINERVFFFPAVKQSVLLEYSASADVGIIPYPHVDLNSYYCTPNKLFEFIQAGLPIITNDSPELNRFVKGNNIGYSGIISSEEDIASLIDEYFEQNINYKDNIKEVRSRISWQKEEEKFINIVRNIL